MAVQLEAALARHVVLPLLDVGVVELLDAAALQAHEVVVVAALVELEHRLARLAILPRQEAVLLELREDAVDRGQADVDAFGDERLVHILGRQVAHLARLEQLEDLAPRQRRLEADFLQALHRAHRLSLYAHAPTAFTRRSRPGRTARRVQLRAAHSRRHPVQDRSTAGQFRLAGNGFATQGGHEQGAGASYAGHAAAG